MGNLQHVVLKNGELNPDLIVRTSELGQQKNVGRLSLTRFWIEENEGLKSYIYKPSDDKFPVEFEIWIQKEVISNLVGVHVPELLAYHIDDQEKVYWMIFEDIGDFKPLFTKSVRVAAASKATNWHALPLQIVPTNYKTFMPYIDEAMKEVLNCRSKNELLLLDIGHSSSEISYFFSTLEKLNGVFPTQKVVSHGDYHCLNLIQAADDLVILDWEFIQLNSPYWDLYILLDMASPRYRIQINKEIRNESLYSYFTQSKYENWTKFNYEYHLYCLIYSVGILGLIAGDLESGHFDRDTLLIQKHEMTEIIRDCFDGVLNS